ncbi:MAG: AtpZ/AtpI family protein [Bacteroidota bacterium]
MKEELEQGKKVINNYLRYSGIGFQIAATIGVGVFIGYQLDKWLHTPQPYFTLGFALVFVILGLYIGLKDFGKKE